MNSQKVKQNLKKGIVLYIFMNNHSGVLHTGESLVKCVFLDLIYLIDKNSLS